MASKAKFNPRKLMELAIKVMRQSVHEPRKNGKASPLVGTVLFKPDGTVDTACRGELRYGDHAEYTLLERKNRHNRLDDCILFATLEPCAPESRRHPKLSCAERIVLARIKEVWIGIEDPDPKVDRKGIRYLQDNGVTVCMFDRDLQEIIHKENKNFIAQAVERAEAAKKKKLLKKVILSQFESALVTSAVDDFSKKALEEYRTRAGILDDINSEAFIHRLLQQGLLKHQDGKLIPTGFGFLLFGEEPRRMIHHAGLLGTIYYPDGKEEPRDFDEPLVLIPDLVEEWLKNKLPSVINRSQMRRKELPVLPFEIVREGLVNALIHRDYDITGAKCQIIVTENTISIKSPGEPLPPVTLKQLQSFSAPMLSRNPLLHYVFARMEMAEERGFGIRSLKNHAEKLKLPLPTYSFENPYIVLTLYRSPESAILAIRSDILEAMNSDERTAWKFVVTKDVVTSTQLMKHMGIEERKAQRIIKKLMDANLLRRIGKGPATKYEVVHP